MPRRRCVGCGRVAPKPELVRLAATGDGRRRVAVIDRAGVLPGRGAYLCRSQDGLDPQCLALAERRGGVARALRCKVKLDPELVESGIR
ncbi:MAG: YlxR family protein [Solirubrobacterales bacterium]